MSFADWIKLVIAAARWAANNVPANCLAGLRSMEQARFVNKHGVLVVAKSGLASGPVMRVTPSLFNTTAELDRLVAAIQA